jgi:hypothetical protein
MGLIFTIIIYVFIGCWAIAFIAAAGFYAVLAISTLLSPFAPMYDRIAAHIPTIDTDTAASIGVWTFIALVIVASI